MGPICHRLNKNYVTVLWKMALRYCNGVTHQVISQNTLPNCTIPDEFHTSSPLEGMSEWDISSWK